MNKAQIEWINEYCKKSSEDEFGLFQTNAGNLEYIYKELKKLESK